MIAVSWLQYSPDSRLFLALRSHLFESKEPVADSHLVAKLKRQHLLIRHHFNSYFQWVPLLDDSEYFIHQSIWENSLSEHIKHIYVVPGVDSDCCNSRVVSLLFLRYCRVDKSINPQSSWYSVIIMKHLRAEISTSYIHWLLLVLRLKKIRSYLCSDILKLWDGETRLPKTLTILNCWDFHHFPIVLLDDFAD